ncbi:hypothetical protein AWB74_02107 [Caballeronia arvi]|uniref:Uncharacterized protein n=1 Tax=Caballeronia arvi TaxID=1777135 RepID=A0A158HSP2_9BURK|nr:hypothetical protein [Caballeronia arvi]SAL47133.1 hypothetical protein AWB74_02107 [Caballeronia arvi]
MAKIKSKITGDEFDAPAVDFQNEADFEIIDSGNELTDGAASDTALSVTSGTTESTAGTSSATDTDQPASQPTEAASTATDSAASEQGAELGNVPGSSSIGSMNGEPEASTTGSDSPTADVGNVAATGISPAASDSDASPVADQAPSNVSTDSPLQSSDVSDAEVPVAPDAAPTPEQAAEGTTDTAAADAATPIDTTVSPVVDSVTGNPTGGPSAGNGATLDSKGKHIVADQLESDTLYAIGQLVAVNDNLKHAADAFFDQVRSQIDVEAADAQ